MLSDATGPAPPPPQPAYTTEALTTLFALGREVTSVLDLDELLQKIPQLISRLTKFQAFAVYLLDERHGDLRIAFAVGYPDEVWPVVDGWIDGEDLWLRRAAIICQVGAKEHTDQDRLFRFCRQRAHESEFFIRKAVGWALRDYSRTCPEAVAGFVGANRDLLSRLSYREATKHIGGLLGR